MGLKESELNEVGLEAKSLGLVTMDHNTDRMIDDFLSKRNKDKNSKKKPEQKRVVKRTAADNKRKYENRDMLEVKTFGFKDGHLVHNMPCPVCLAELAEYEKGDFFGPCKRCKSKGYILKKKIFS